jgi:23S rRNA maturation mini-RNase III
MSSSPVSSEHNVQPVPLQAFIATLRCIINVESAVDAEVTAERLRQIAMEYLDEEEGDEVVVTQVMDTAIALEPTETLNVLKRARNALIKTRIKQCYDMARGLDETIHALEHRENIGGVMPTYDYGRLLEIAEAILQRGENPL